MSDKGSDGAGHWVEQVSADGRLMYYNARTLESTYVKPRELYTEEEIAEEAYDFFWVADNELAWVPARKMSEGKFKLYATGHLVSKRPDQVGPQISAIASTKVLISDLVQLDDVNESSIIWLLYQRFKAQKYYTAVGDILISVNPFRRTNSFTDEQVKRYQGRVAGMNLPPHPYTIVDDAYKAIQDAGKDQSILISGESGAGKTFTVRVCLSYISKVAGSPTGVEKKVLGTNPILEAFGNAKTMRNDNSSRFGKFMQLYFNQSYEIIGCEIENYLLEKSRIADQQDGERNFHIFYYLTGLLPPNQKKLLLLDDAREYRYMTRSSCFNGDTHSDVEEFDDAIKAFKEIGFPDEERDSIFKVTSAVLQIGNIDFEEGDAGGTSKVSAKHGFKYVSNAAQLIGVPVETLKAILTQNVSKVAGTEMVRGFTVRVAEQARDSLAKGLYGRLFDWLVQRLNKSMVSKAEGYTPKQIGMVDIFGFEIFKHNSFEQLCINFANEKLQQMFNKHTFLLEEKTYREEGITFDPVTFYDSQPLLDLLGLTVKGFAKVGLFQQLDVQTQMNGNEEKFLSSVNSRHGSKTTTKHGQLVQFFTRHRLKKKCFIIEHYAGPVRYNVSGWISKNADKLHSNQLKAMKNSSNTLVATLFASNKGARSTTQTSKFLSQLRALEKSVDSTWPRFVRCVKPNQMKSAVAFNGVESLQQLRFAGVFEAVAIRKQGFPFRETHESFYKKYRIISPACMAIEAAHRVPPWLEWSPDQFAEGCRKLLQDCTQHRLIASVEEIRFGKTMCLYRSEQNQALGLARFRATVKYILLVQTRMRALWARRYVRKIRCAIHVQRFYRGKRARRLTAMYTRHLPELERAVRSLELDLLHVACKKVEDIEFPFLRIRQARAIIEHLEEELRLNAEIRRVNQLDDVSEAFDQISRLMKQYRRRRDLADQDPALRSIPENAALLEAVESFKELVQIAAQQDEYIAEADRLLAILDGAAQSEDKIHLHETVRTLRLLLGSFDTISNRMARISKSADIPQQARCKKALQELEQEFESFQHFSKFLVGRKPMAELMQNKAPSSSNPSADALGGAVGRFSTISVDRETFKLSPAEKARYESLWMQMTSPDANQLSLAVGKDVAVLLRATNLGKTTLRSIYSTVYMRIGLKGIHVTWDAFVMMLRLASWVQVQEKRGSQVREIMPGHFEMVCVEPVPPVVLDMDHRGLRALLRPLPRQAMHSVENGDDVQKVNSAALGMGGATLGPNSDGDGQETEMAIVIGQLYRFTQRPYKSAEGQLLLALGAALCDNLVAGQTIALQASEVDPDVAADIADAGAKPAAEEARVAWKAFEKTCAALESAARKPRADPNFRPTQDFADAAESIVSVMKEDVAFSVKLLEMREECLVLLDDYAKDCADTKGWRGRVKLAAETIRTVEEKQSCSSVPLVDLTPVYQDAKRLQRENEVVQRLRGAFLKGGLFPNGLVRHRYKDGIPLVYQISLEDVGYVELEDEVKQYDEYPFCTGDGARAISICRAFAALRKGLYSFILDNELARQSQVNGNGTDEKTNEARANSEQSEMTGLKLADLVRQARAACDVFKGDAAEDADFTNAERDFLITCQKELHVSLDYVAAANAVEDMVAKLAVALQSVSIEHLGALLDTAAVLRVHTHPRAAFRDAYCQAQELLHELIGQSSEDWEEVEVAAGVGQPKRGRRRGAHIILYNSKTGAFVTKPPDVAAEAQIASKLSPPCLMRGGLVLPKQGRVLGQHFAKRFFVLLGGGELQWYNTEKEWRISPRESSGSLGSVNPQALFLRTETTIRRLTSKTFAVTNIFFGDNATSAATDIVFQAKSQVETSQWCEALQVCIASLCGPSHSILGRPALWASSNTLRQTAGSRTHDAATSAQVDRRCAVSDDRELLGWELVTGITEPEEEQTIKSTSKLSVFEATALYDFRARVAANELSITRGQKLVLFVPRKRVEAVQKGTDASLWQWARDAAGDEGWVPSNRLNIHASNPVVIRVGEDGSDVIVSPELAELDYVMKVGQRKSQVPKTFTYWYNRLTGETRSDAMARPDLPSGSALWVVLKHNANGFGRQVPNPVDQLRSSPDAHRTAVRMRNPNASRSVQRRELPQSAGRSPAVLQRQLDMESKWAESSWNIRASRRPADDPTLSQSRAAATSALRDVHSLDNTANLQNSSIASEDLEDMWMDGEYDLIGEDLTVVQRAEPYVKEMEEAVQEISLNRIRSVLSAGESLQIGLRHPDEFVRSLFDEAATLARLLQNSVTNLSIDFLPSEMKEALADTDILDTHEVPSPKKLNGDADSVAESDTDASAAAATHRDEPAVFHQTPGALGSHAAGSFVKNAEPYFHPHHEDEFSLDEWASVREFSDGEAHSPSRHGAGDNRVRYVAVYRYDAGHSDELSVARDEVLYFHGPQPGESLEEWVQVENSYGDIGAVPVAVLRKVDAGTLVDGAELQQGPGFEPVDRAPQELQQEAAETRVRAVEEEEKAKAQAAAEKEKAERKAEAARKKEQKAKKEQAQAEAERAQKEPPQISQPNTTAEASPQIASIKMRRRVFQETQVRLTVLYNVREGDSTLKNCITAVRGDKLVGIAKDGEWWQCAHVGDEAALKADAKSATFIPDSYVQVDVVTIDQEVMEAVGAEDGKELTVDLNEQSEYQARLKKQADDLQKKNQQLEEIRRLAKQQEERAARAERERERVAQEKKELDASLRQREEDRSRELKTFEERQAELKRQQDLLDQERQRMQAERDRIEEERRSLAATQREQSERAAELRAKAFDLSTQPQQQSPDNGQYNPRHSQNDRSPRVADREKQQRISVERDLSDRSNKATSEIEDNLVSLLSLPSGTHLVDVHLSPGSMGCIVAEEQLNGVQVIVVDELRPTAQPGLKEGDIVAGVNGTSTIGRDTDFFSSLITTAGPRCLSLLRQGNSAGTAPSEPSPGSTFEVKVPQGPIGVVFRGVGGDVVVEGFNQDSPLRRSGEVWVGDRLVAVCGDDVRSRGLSYAIQKVIDSQHMSGRTLVFERGGAKDTRAASPRVSRTDGTTERADYTWNLIEELPPKQLRHRLQAFEGLDLGGVTEDDMPRIYNQIIEETASRPDVSKPRPFVPNRLTKPIASDDPAIPFLPDIFDLTTRFIEGLPPNKSLQVCYTAYVSGVNHHVTCIVSELFQTDEETSTAVRAKGQ